MFVVTRVFDPLILWFLCILSVCQFPYPSAGFFFFFQLQSQSFQYTVRHLTPFSIAVLPRFLCQCFSSYYLFIKSVVNTVLVIPVAYISKVNLRFQSRGLDWSFRPGFHSSTFCFTTRPPPPLTFTHFPLVYLLPKKLLDTCVYFKVSLLVWCKWNHRAAWGCQSCFGKFKEDSIQPVKCCVTVIQLSELTECSWGLVVRSSCSDNCAAGNRDTCVYSEMEKLRLCQMLVDFWETAYDWFVYEVVCLPSRTKIISPT